ncbi:MAG: DUF481 domain-containing protein [Algicola sp.]|nr:DUF481 domain-containing protein [Algicola sp.]
MKTTILKWWLLPLSYLLTSPSQSQTADLEFVKAVDPALYKKLVKIELCRKKQLTAQQCKTNLQASNTTAEEPTKTGTPQQAQVPARPRDWWLSSTYESTAPVKDWFHAIQSNISLVQMTGNLDGSQYNSQINYFSRYQAWTNSLYLGYSKDNIKQSDILVSDRSTRFLHYSGRLDLNSMWFGQFGFIHEQDNTLSIQSKDIPYIGVGAYLKHSPKYKLQMLAAIGNRTEALSSATSAATGQSEFDDKVAYLYQKFSWLVSKELKFNQSFSLLYAMNDQPDFAAIGTTDCIDTLSDTASYCVKKYGKSGQLTLTLGLEYQLNKYISLIYNLNLEHYNQPLLNDESNNSTHNIGIQASFQ